MCYFLFLKMCKQFFLFTLGRELREPGIALDFHSFENTQSKAGFIFEAEESYQIFFEYIILRQ
jgi:hypothetical protein